MTISNDKDAKRIIAGAVLWAKIKAECLELDCPNPYLSFDENGSRVVTCPRCGYTGRDNEFTVLSVMPDAVMWCAPIRKCPNKSGNCGHLFSFIT